MCLYQRLSHSWTAASVRWLLCRWFSSPDLGLQLLNGSDEPPYSHTFFRFTVFFTPEVSGNIYICFLRFYEWKFVRYRDFHGSEPLLDSTENTRFPSPFCTSGSAWKKGRLFSFCHIKLGFHQGKEVAVIFWGHGLLLVYLSSSCWEGKCVCVCVQYIYEHTHIHKKHCVRDVMTFKEVEIRCY